MKIFRMLTQLKRSTIGIEVDTNKEFLFDLIHLANSKKDKLDKMVKEIVERNPEDAQDIYEHYLDQYQTYNSEYVKLSNNSALVNAYSFFEYELKGICQIVNGFVVNKKGTFKYIKGLSYAENAKNKIAIITGLDFSSFDAQWNTLDGYRIIRNLIVHNGANLLEKDDKTLENQQHFSLVSSFPEIKINDNGDFFIVDEKLVIDYLDLVSGYLITLLDNLGQLDNNDIK